MACVNINVAISTRTGIVYNTYTHDSIFHVHPMRFEDTIVQRVVCLARRRCIMVRPEKVAHKHWEYMMIDSWLQKKPTCQNCTSALIWAPSCITALCRQETDRYMLCKGLILSLLAGRFFDSDLNC